MRAAGGCFRRCRVLAFTRLRPSELIRYRPGSWNRTAQTLVGYTGKGGRTPTMPCRAPAAEALADPAPGTTAARQAAGRGVRKYRRYTDVVSMAWPVGDRAKEAAQGPVGVAGPAVRRSRFTHGRRVRTPSV